MASSNTTASASSTSIANTADDEFILPFEFSTNPNADMRTVNVKHVVAGAAEPEEFYKFFHPLTGVTTGVTSIHRRNLATQRWENAGEVEWTNNWTAHVYFGLERVNMKEVRQLHKRSSKSRRFKAKGIEYKWKIADNGTDLFCVNLRGKTIATWTQEDVTLRVIRSAEPILDRVVFTCFLNLWMKNINAW
ncbi:hypothetical protein OBBRIDRAFT_94950 [Obba rivulosa]|uniref:DUF6593 domain-containing protein n=1 Tax=Obba rivulosa TaxID=1052685 RepID=A0A8E2DMQ1_9APHY|nr:hypothetical protein OBBRIDRAFT_94950 [Obba rivulosa]